MQCCVSRGAASPGGCDVPVVAELCAVRCCVAVSGDVSCLPCELKSMLHDALPGWRLSEASVFCV